MITYRGREFPDARTARASVLEFDAGPALAVADAEPPMPVAPMLERRRDEPKRRALVDKYRPRTLAEVAGQPEVLAMLKDFAAMPYSWLVHDLKALATDQPWNLTWTGAESGASVRCFFRGSPKTEIILGISDSVMS